MIVFDGDKWHETGGDAAREKLTAEAVAPDMTDEEVRALLPESVDEMAGSAAGHCWASGGEQRLFSAKEMRRVCRAWAADRQVMHETRDTLAGWLLVQKVSRLGGKSGAEVLFVIAERLEKALKGESDE